MTNGRSADAAVKPLASAAPGSAGDDLPLSGLLVLDVADEMGAYTGRLLADLGAEVVRVEPPNGDPLRDHAPFIPNADGSTSSAYAMFLGLNKRSVTLDLTGPADRATFLELLATADVLVDTWTPGADDPPAFDQAVIEAANPRLIRVSVTPFGQVGPRAREVSTDLTRLAAGGLLSLGGYPDTGPTAVYGGQSNFAASIFGAVSTLLALIARHRDGRGRWIDVSAQEAIAAAMEDAIPEYDLNGTIRRRAGDRLREAGTGILPCKDGYVSMVAGRLGTAAAWKSLTEWLVEAGEPGAEELLGDEWKTLTFRQLPSSIARFSEIFGSFASRWTRQDLYLEAQRRNIALAPVNEIADLLDNPQLQGRGFFVSISQPELAQPVMAPGRPYRLSAATPRFHPAPQPGEANAELLPVRAERPEWWPRHGQEPAGHARRRGGDDGRLDERELEGV